jgi:hypothetical protein
MPGLETSRNRAMVLAQFLRNAARDIRDSAGVKKIDAEAFTNAVESIDAVAEELEGTAEPVAPEDR